MSHYIYKIETNNIVTFYFVHIVQLKLKFSKTLGLDTKTNQLQSTTLAQ